MRAAGIILVGGPQEGMPKADLAWESSTLLHRTVQVLASVVTGPLVVVGAPGQELPDLPDGVEVGTDAVPGRGPLEGLAAGLRLVGDRAPVAFLAATDMPMLHPAFVRCVLSELVDPDVDVAVPFVRGYRQSLSAGYRTTITPLLDGLLASGRRWPSALFAHCRVRILHEADLLAHPELAAADPHLNSVVNCNDAAAYEAARVRFERTV
jgi:molybdopterin-guanine dinucleotide biosynthesis protein A